MAFNEWGSDKVFKQLTGIVGSDGNTADIIATNGNYGIVALAPAHLSTVNSTHDVLDVDEVFTGTGEDVLNFGTIVITVNASHVSATDGLEIQFSHNNTDWSTTDEYTIPANTCKTYSIQTQGQYFRIKYTNGGTLQTSFDLCSVYKPYYVKPSSHRLADTISNQDDAELIKSILSAFKSDNTSVNIGATDSGNLKTTDAENTLAIAKGEVVGASDINKWGNAPDFDTADGFVDVWDGAEDGTAWELMNYVFPTSATIDSISSTDAGDANTVTLQGLDTNGDEVTQQVTLNGQNRVALTTPLLRFFRGYNDNGTEFAGHIIVYDNTAISGGVPTDKTKIRGVIHPDEQQTEMAIYTIPSGKTGYLLGGYCSTAGANKSSNYVIKFQIRSENGVFRTQQKVALEDGGTSFIQFDYAIPQKLEALTDVKVQAKMTAGGGAGASISAGFSIVLIDN